MTVAAAVKAIKRKSLHEELAESLEELIVSGQLTPGAKVPEKELCERYGVSRTPMREALKVLAQLGLVDLEPNRGAWVSRITPRDVAEVFAVMGALEALSGELACERITDRELADLQARHDRMVAQYRAGDLKAYFAENQAIHEGILAASGNGTLIAQYRSLAARIRMARYAANMTDARWRQAVEEHEAIMRHLHARDGERLSATLKAHLKNKLETVRDWLLREQPTAPD